MRTDPAELQKCDSGTGWLQYDNTVLKGIDLGLTGFTSQGLFFNDPSHGGGCLLTATPCQWEAKIITAAGSKSIMIFDGLFVNSR